MLCSGSVSHLGVVRTGIRDNLAQKVKNPPACGRPRFDPWVGKIPWRGEWLPTLVLWPGKSRGQRSLAGCSPWAHTELNITETT